MEALTNVKTSSLVSQFTPAINGFLFPVTLTFSIPFKPFRSLRLSLRSSSSSSSSEDHTTLLVETFHDHRSFKTLLKRLTKADSCPLRLLKEDGDWTKEHFWAVVRFLRKVSRATEIPLVFEMWKSIEKSRINELNYSKIVQALSEAGLMEEAVTLLKDSKNHGLGLSLEAYNSVIHGFARKGHFEEALFHIDEMKDSNVAPESDTFDGLIEAYAERKMYDDIGMCLKKMKLNGCPPDHITYNMVMREFSRGGLLKKMESTYHTMISKNMHLQPPTLLVMLETYARFGILDKMEKFYTRALKTKTPLTDGLVRKIAEVYINNYMYSKIERLGVELYSTFGERDLFWCLRLLSHACLFSRKGMDSVIEEMEEKRVPWNATISNIICLIHLKKKNFTHLRSSLTEMTLAVDPDMMSVGILFDAIDLGFDGTKVLEAWKTQDVLCKTASMNTDPLVLVAFGKGRFLINCEVAFSALAHEGENKTWTYNNLIELVRKHKGSY